MQQSNGQDGGGGQGGRQDHLAHGHGNLQDPRHMQPQAGTTVTSVPIIGPPMEGT
jgi:hypothetical protein